MLALFIISELPDEVSLSELRSILVSCGELEPMDIDGYISSLSESGQIYITDDAVTSARYEASAEKTSEHYVGITQSGEAVVSAFSKEKALCGNAINRALRMYKKLTCGIEYKISLEKADGGSYVRFEMFVNERLYFSTALFFANAHEALVVCNRMDSNPDAFYNGFLTVATGEVEYL